MCFSFRTVDETGAEMDELRVDAADFLVKFHSDFASGSLGNAAEFSGRALFINASPEIEVSGNWRSPVGRFLELECTVEGKGDWLGLHLSLDPAKIYTYSYLFLLLRINGHCSSLMRVCLRSVFLDGSYRDIFFDKHLFTDVRPRTHLDALYLDAYPDLPDNCAFRELVIFLPVKSFKLHIHHLKLIWC